MVLPRAWLGPVRRFASVASSSRTRIPQTIIEKVVQKHAVGLPDGKLVKAGDYVMIRPQHVMTHDNTGPVISKCVILSWILGRVSDTMKPTGLTPLVLQRFMTEPNPFSPSTMMSRTSRRRTSPNIPRSRSSRGSMASTSTPQDEALATRSWLRRDTRSLKR